MATSWSRILILIDARSYPDCRATGGRVWVRFDKLNSPGSARTQAFTHWAKVTGIAMAE